MGENNKTFIVKDEHIKFIIEALEKSYTEKKESFDKRGVTPENVEKILKMFSGKNAAFVKCCIIALASILPVKTLKALIKILQPMLKVKLTEELIRKINEIKKF